MKDWNVAAVSELILEAGRIALGHFRGDPDVAFKSDHTIVTEADREIEHFLAIEMDRPQEGVYLIGEETSSERDAAYFAAARQETAWIVDPIDGTMPYSLGLPSWGVSIGFMREGRIEHGALFMPVFGTLLISDDREIMLGEAGCDVVRWGIPKLSPLEEPLRPNHGGGVIGVPQEIAKWGRYTGKQSVQAIGSCVYSLMQYLLGSYCGYIAIAKLWDIGAALALLDRCGAAMQMANGAPMDTTVTDRQYNLSFGERHYLELNGYLYIAPDEEQCTTMRSNTFRGIDIKK